MGAKASATEIPEGLPAAMADAVRPDDFHYSWGFLVSRLRQKIVARNDIVLREFGVTALMYGVLLLLSENDGISQVELAERMGVKKASLTAPLARLSVLGLISRTRKSNDRRRNVLRVSAKGKNTVAAARRRLDAVTREVEVRLPGFDPNRLKAMLLALEKAVEAS